MATLTGANPTLRRDFTLLALAALLIAVAIGGFYFSQSSAARNQAALSSSRQLVESLNALAKAASDPARGASPDFSLISARSQALDDTLQEYQSTAGFGGLPAGFTPELDALVAAWGQMKVPLATVQAAEVPYGRVATNVAAIADVVPPASTAYEEATEKLANTPGRGGDTFLVSRQLARLSKIVSSAQAVLRKGKDAEASSQQLTNEVLAFGRDHKALATTGVIDRSAAQYVTTAFETVETASIAISQDLKPVAEMQVAAAGIEALNAKAVAAAQALQSKISNQLKLGSSAPLLAMGAGALALALLGIYAYLTISQARLRDQATAEREGIQQQAILSLLDEITNLANGDLTGELTVTADFTGNIADSLNYTVQTLRGLVGTINSTSVEIAAAASSTTERVQRMSTASEGQAREIVRATQSISYASRSLEDVAGRAEKLADQAKGSVDTAHNGAATVGRTIVGMATLREQIQDTAKRIKRLGESSQEIGNIIEFINDIAEQTNTLALNASIQAAMAGESGRGFAVVADEVQRLAERAASATKQIESLIKTIQTDTQEAITSMERSTANVVGGAKNAEEAGLALTRIEASSQELAKVIQDIAGAARTQSVETTKLATTMQGIREVSMQTSTTAHQTAESVGELNVLSAKLRESVSGFKLPMDVSSF